MFDRAGLRSSAVRCPLKACGAGPSPPPDAAAVRDCLIEGYEPLIDELKFPDPGDRHVLAAAIRAGAQDIVIGKRKHSLPRTPSSGTSKPRRPMTSYWTSSALTRTVTACVQQLELIRGPARPQAVEDGLSQLEGDGLVESIAARRIARPWDIWGQDAAPAPPALLRRRSRSFSAPKGAVCKAVGSSAAGVSASGSS